MCVVVSLTLGRIGLDTIYVKLMRTSTTNAYDNVIILYPYHQHVPT